MLVVADVLDMNTAHDLIRKAEINFIRGVPTSQHLPEIVSILKQGDGDESKE